MEKIFHPCRLGFYKMGVKCIAIGNRIMGDDAIGIKVAQELQPQLQQNGIEVIFGETDLDYALRSIADGDYLFILDATHFNVETATVTHIPLQDTMKQLQQLYPVFSQHQPSLIEFLTTYNIKVEGYIIGIEVEEINFSLELSNELKTRFSDICGKVYNFIHHTLK